MKNLNREIYDIINHDLFFDDLLVVKKGVKFGDVLWDFTDETNERNISIPKCKMKFNWQEIEKKIGKRMVNDLKILTYFMITAPSLFGIGGNHKINTLQPRIIKICSVIEEILIEKQLRNNFIEKIDIFCLGDLTLSQIQEIPIHTSKINEVKIVLKAMAISYIQPYFLKPIKWVVADVNNLNLIAIPKGDIKEVSTTPLSEEYYIEVIKQITIDIVNFKLAMHIPVNTKLTKILKDKLYSESLNYNVTEAFKRYAEILERNRLCSLKRGKRVDNSTQHRKQFYKKFNVQVGVFNALLKKTHAASIMAILIFTGVRYSELISLKKGCIELKKDVYVMKGTVTKHKSDTLPTDIDEWVAIPIVRDAIDILELIQTLTKNSFLVAPLRGVYLNQKDLPLSDSGVKELLNVYILNSGVKNKAIEKFTKNMEKNKITPHRLRHNLAQQLVRGKLGLPYISYHFKHINAAVVAYNSVSNVTLGYGGISKEITNSAISYQKAKKELYEQIYSPTAVVAGGGNAKEFMNRKTEYFQGLMVNDEEVEGIIEDLKEQSLPFLDVGLGYCGGRKDLILPNGKKQAPPCIGQLKCNPVDCGNAVIPRSKLPIWKKVYDNAVEKLQDTEFNYMEIELKEIIKRAEKVLNHFH